MNSEVSNATLASHEVIQGGGEMGELIRAKDWGETPLGPIELWPQSLLTATSICLNATMPVSILWGRELIQIYNDGYIAIAVGRHPRILGGRVPENWPDTWPGIKDYFEAVFEGRPVYVQHTLLPTARHGIEEEVYYTMSFSPIRDESGGVGGVFHTIQETTSEVLHERRLRTTRYLAGELADAKSIKEIFERTTAALRDNPHDVPFVLCYEIDRGEQARLVSSVGVSAGEPIRPEAVDLSDEKKANGWPFLRATHAPAGEHVIGLNRQAGAVRAGPWPEPITHAMAMPIALPGEKRPVALVIAGLSPRRVLDEGYRAFFTQIAGTVGTAVANVLAYEKERKRAEALAELDRAKTVFFSNVSHEFRTPLTLLLGPLEDEMRENPAAQRRLELAYRNSLRLLKLVNTLLDFSRIEAGRIQAAFEPTELAVLTADLASVFRSTIERAGLRLVIDCPPLPEPAYVDREMWEKIVLNLLSNAFKFTFQGQIKVELHQEGSWVELTVKDTGVGIPPGEVERVFERFHRVRGTRARSHEGTGIGLALVQELVKLHGGEVKVRSIEGQGTTFTVRVRTGTAHLPPDRIGPVRTLTSTSLGARPFVEEALRWLPEEAGGSGSISLEEEPTSGIASEIEAMAERRDRFCILLADDNADMRDYVRRLLLPKYEVVTVPDGEAALQMVRQSKVDLVVSDVMMPRLDGFGLLRVLRADPALKAMPVILLSARAGEEARLEGLRAGADSYLVKPFSARELLVHVEKDLAMARIRREAAEAFAEINHRLVTALEASGTGTFRWDVRTNEITWDESMGRLYGLAPGEKIHSVDQVMSRIHPEDRAGMIGQLEQSRERGENFEMEHRIVRPDGAVRWIYSRGKTIASEDGKPGYMTGASVDITDRKRAEEALRAANRELNDFAAIVSHDLKSPLRGVTTLAKWLLRDYAGKLDSEGREYLDGIVKRVGRMDQMIEDILQYSRLGRTEEKPEPVDLAELVPIVVHDLAPPEHVHIHVAPRLPTVRGEPVRLRQVFQNLIGNAIKYADKPQVEIRVDCAGVGPYWEFRVADNGPGIEARHFERIFRMFQSLAPKDKTDSTGVGLALVKRIVERAGGQVWVESHIGHGSTFFFTWPKAPLVSEPERSQREQGRASSPVPAPAQHHSLLATAEATG